jgi:hypothetical protein
MDIKKYFTYFGFAGVGIYIGGIALGSFLGPTYSQITNTISVLDGNFAPYRALFALLFALANLCLIIFATGLYLSKSKNIKIAAACLAIVGFLNIILNLFFPMDSTLGVRTQSDLQHNAIVGVIVIGIMLAMIFTYFGSRKSDILQGVKNYFLTSLLASLLAWGLATWAVFSSNYYSGLTEKVAIILFLQWVFILSFELLVGKDRISKQMSPKLVNNHEI